MPILVVCPACQQKLGAPDEAAGKAVRCPGCDQVMRIPVQAEPASVKPSLGLFDGVRPAPAISPAPELIVAEPKSVQQPAKAAPARPSEAVASDAAAPRARAPEPKPVKVSSSAVSVRPVKAAQADDVAPRTRAPEPKYAKRKSNESSGRRGNSYDADDDGPRRRRRGAATGASQIMRVLGGIGAAVVAAGVIGAISLVAFQSQPVDDIVVAENNFAAIQPAPGQAPVMRAMAAERQAEKSKPAIQEIKPPVIAGAKVERELPETIGDAVLGGNGRYLFLHMPQLKQIAMFDITEARVVHNFPAGDDVVHFAAGATKLVVVLGTAHVIQRWNLETKERELAVATPVEGVIRSIAMGSASEGPVLVASAKGANALDRGAVDFVDLPSLKAIAVENRGTGRYFLFRDQMHFRASADGQTFGVWASNNLHPGMHSFVLTGHIVNLYYDTDRRNHILPGPDGTTLHTNSGPVSRELKALDNAPRGNPNEVNVPAVHGHYYVRLAPQNEAPRPGEPAGKLKATVQITGDNRPLANLPDLDVVLPNPAPASGFTLDKRVHFIPDAKVVVVLPAGNRKVVVHRFDVNEAIENSGLDYLVVSSRPPLRAAVNEPYVYVMDVKSNRGGVKYRLESGPPGMNVDAAGKLTWTPRSQDAVEQNVVVAVSDNSGRDVSHRFKIGIGPQAVAQLNPPPLRPDVAPNAKAPQPQPKKDIEVAKLNPEPKKVAFEKKIDGPPAKEVVVERKPREARPAEFGVAAAAGPNGPNGKPLVFVQPPPLKGKLPLALEANDVRRVKAATVRFRVTLIDGDVAEGSGFFAFAKGLVVTNAHVIDMLDGGPPPKKVEITVFSGLDEEFTREGVILAVDRTSDLAILRFVDKGEALPLPLYVAIGTPLVELQKVFAFGFPLGTRLGKDISVTESSISSLRKGKDGLLGQIQLNGGITRGNSGGPIVDTRGNVVGVAVSGIVGTQINFAIPYERVLAAVEPRLRRVDVGDPMMAQAGGPVTLPVALAVTDPFSRIKTVRMESWLGARGAARAAAAKLPKAEATDEAFAFVPVKLENGAANVQLKIPYPIPSGKAIWTRAVLEFGNGNVYFGAAQPLAAGAAVQAVPATLEYDPARAPERTLAVSSKIRYKIVTPDEKLEFANALEATAHEVVAPMPDRDIDVKLAFGKFQVTSSKNGAVSNPTSDAVDRIRASTFHLVATREGDLRERLFPVWTGTGPVRVEGETAVDLFLNAYESASLFLPNRDVKPLESWSAEAPLYFLAATNLEAAIAFLNCTYAGTRDEGGRPHAVIRFRGAVRSRGLSPARGEISGVALFDLEKRMIANLQIAGQTQIDAGPVRVEIMFDATLARTAGNAQSIATPNPNRVVTFNTNFFGPLAILNGRKVMQKAGVLTPADAVDPRSKDKSPHHDVFVELQKDRYYVFDLMSPNDTLMDPMLRLEIANSTTVIATDDDSGGDLNSRIVYKPDTTQTVRVVVTSPDHMNVGPYTLRVLEVDAAPPRIIAGKAPVRPTAPPVGLIPSIPRPGMPGIGPTRPGVGPPPRPTTPPRPGIPPRKI